MNDGPAAVPAPAPASAAAYARIYEEHQPRLAAYARSLTRNAWAAEDVVAEAHFRVWRRLAAGHEIDNVPAYLMTTVRHLATAAGGAVRETPQDPQAAERVVEQSRGGVHRDDPAEQVSSVDLLVRVLGQLPERWVKALWLAEAEGQPLAAVGSHIGAKDGATAVLLHRAREGMRQAFLRTQPGAPGDPACEVHWGRMPAYVRGAATARQSERLLGHADTCDDCRGRLAVLMRANDRLPALVGPALLGLALGGAGKFLAPFAAGSAGASAAAQVAAGGHGGGMLHAVRGVVGGGAKAPAAVAVGAAVAGAVVLSLALGPMDSSPAPQDRTPVAKAPVASPSKDVLAAAPAKRGPSADAAEEKADGAPARTGATVASWTDGAAVDRPVVRADDVSPAPPESTKDEPTADDPAKDDPAKGEPAAGGEEQDPGTSEPGEKAPEPEPDPETPTPVEDPPVEEPSPAEPPVSAEPDPATPAPDPADPAPDPATPAPDPATPAPDPADPPAPVDPVPADPQSPPDPGGDCGGGRALFP
ncbi:zf-HC2 domain-containing protein [Streptomyces sp. NBC_01275]|uniref:sigma factor n=1 Tax=Streptomyces sp. NBC_01275 TaxID=2903807 RepID=UPI002253494D|nr:sigma factor [Streptomyces sp. NBC_01275]MCX4760284.1 zf-HC2 domain-containing protein [Streptomyces sp. NBC_01275]